MRIIVPSLLFLTACLPALAAVDTGLLALVPAGAKVISGVDIAKARSSPFGQYMLSKMGTDSADFQQMMEQTGFDPRRDVQDAIFFSAGPGTSGSNSRFGVLVRGNFDHARVTNTVLAKGATVQSYQGVQLLVNSSSHGNSAFAFADVDIAAVGDLATVEQVITNRANPSNLDPALQQLISTAGTDHDAWFASITSGSFLSGKLPAQTGQTASPAALQSILQSSGGVSFGNVVEASFDAVTRSAKDATSVADVVRFGTSVIQMQRQKDPRAGIIADSLDNMTLQTNGSNVHISLSIPESGLEQLADLNVQGARSGATKASKPSMQ